MSALQYPLTFAAAKRAEKSQWAIGDALLEEIGPPHAGKRQEDAFAECARELADRGMPYTSKYLRDLRNTAYSFHPEERSAGLSTSTALGAGDPRTLAKAEELAEEQGVPVTQRFVKKMRKAARKDDRRAKGLPQPPTRDRSRVKDRPATELRRLVDLGDLETRALKAAKLGRDFAEAIAGVSLTAAERRELQADVAKVISTWEAVAQIVDAPLSDEVEDYLKEMS